MSKKTKNNLLSERLTYTGASSTRTHLHLCTYHSAGSERMESQSFEPIRRAIKSERVNWLEIHGLQDTTLIQEVCKYFKINFLVIQDILNPNHPTKIEELEHYTVCIMKVFHTSGEDSESQQLCLILGENFVLSFFEQENDFFAEVYAAIEQNIFGVRARTSDYLFSVLLNSVIGNHVGMVTALDNTAEELEESLISINNSRDIGAQIQNLRRQYMTIKRVVQPLKEQYVRLLRSESSRMNEQNRIYFSDVNDHLQYVLQTLDICRETLASLVDLYVSNTEMKMNEIMKRLTIVSTLFIPLTFFAGVWGMNFKVMPELEWQYGYLLAWVLMVLAAGGVFLYFKRKKWY